MHEGILTRRLDGKVAIVIGAGSIAEGWGNGKAVAVLFARHGARLVCADVNEEAACETASIIADEGGQVIATRADATSAADLEHVIRQAQSAYGRVDVLINNVGIVSVGGVVETSEAQWDRVFDVNLKSCFLAMKHVIPIMEQQGSGSIINISSVASIRYTGVPYATYYATKASMNHLTRTTAAQYASKGVRVNAILPGLMKTPMVESSAKLASSYGDGDVERMWERRSKQVPMGHMGDAWDVAYAALFLASDESRYVTGIELLVDGGFTLQSGR